MSQQFTIGPEISVALLRDYIIKHVVNAGDSIILSARNFEHITDELSRSGHLPVPLEIMGVHILKDRHGNVETGKIRIVKDDNLHH